MNCRRYLHHSQGAAKHEKPLSSETNTFTVSWILQNAKNVRPYILHSLVGGFMQTALPRKLAYVNNKTDIEQGQDPFR